MEAYLPEAIYEAVTFVLLFSCVGVVPWTFRMRALR